MRLQDGNLKPFVKSEPIPEINNEPVKVVVSDSLQAMVFNSGKNGSCFLPKLFQGFLNVFMHDCY